MRDLGPFYTDKKPVFKLILFSVVASFVKFKRLLFHISVDSPWDFATLNLSVKMDYS